ncbi:MULTISPECIES: hypothetical protein [unclassified Mesorhizobium]|uniref:hypothetical protein n=1 Tax=unclassified Mesorhizobium TaxID=325217 RepID=UPI000FCBCF69|nr:MULTISPECIES: hypothetical protein [unclassified Mesorhizobium]RUZ82783.1 hypothetical protein EN947_17075 [Mesorhizobium sp. M7A.F.Ca.US.003.02.2.1]RUY93913.1 hypothetical protein EN974_24965 [Mesorhizobium sp. M7A.F.Ca.CA.001.12.2.1]RUZ25242.1 hypothetical protein EN949_14500 [Mesorhizobium sp. M7A.F.Ca.US.007.01.2.1]RUZ49882.1 hypothetical protein EN948_03035 [Mesorhizobium sp. M7A.F.Ca.US.003.02.1.1]RUZ70311.1 hypothetical protein EN950_01035 [Mesorhizobium sp. M7A.F.Ca.US.007.01.1.1]
MAIFLLLVIVIVLVGASVFFGAIGIVLGLFAAVFVLVYFFGMTVQGFLISFVVFLAGLFAFNLFFPDDRPKGKG